MISNWSSVRFDSFLGHRYFVLFQQAVLPVLRLVHLVDGFVGVLDDMEPVDDLRGVGQVLADTLGESSAHVARDQPHAVRVAVVVHEIPCEPFDGMRVLARRHADHVALRQVGGHGDAPVAPAAGLVDAYRLHARVVPVRHRLVHVMADEAPQAGVVLADLYGDVRDRLAFRQFHDHRLEQERGPTARTRPRHRHGPHVFVFNKELLIRGGDVFLDSPTGRRTPLMARYGREQRGRAVDLYVRYERCAADVIRELGHPGKGALLSWYADRLEEERTRGGDAQEEAPDGRREESRRGDYGVGKHADVRIRASGHGGSGGHAGSMEARLARLQARLDELDADVERQRREKKELDIEIAIRKGTLELLGKEPGTDPENPASREKTILVKQTSERLGVTAGSLLPAVGVARGTYHYQPDAMKRPDKDAPLLELVREAFENSERRYGYKRIHLEPESMGIRVSAKRIMRLMTKNGLKPSFKSAKRYGSYKGELTKAPANLADGDFHAERPNMPWVTDLTEFSIPAGKACPSPVIDCHDGMPVAWTIGTSPDSALANGMLADACSTLKDGEKPIIHSDHGCRYRWPGWIRIRKDDDLTRSTGAKGCSPDNAAAEGFLGRPRQEFFHKRSFAGVSMDGFINMLDDYMVRYRDKRIKTESGHGHHGPSTQTRSYGMIGGDGINDESNKTAPSPSSEGASNGTRTRKPKRSILSRLRIPISPWRPAGFSPA